MRIGLDLGGTKLEAVVLNDLGVEIFRQRVPTPHSQDQDAQYAAIVAAIVELVAHAESSIGARASVGVGTPGSISPATGLLKNSNTTCLNGKPLLADLQRALQRPIRIANDANCFALSEAVDGSGRGAEVVFGVILGTGVGGGVVVRGQVLQGINAIAGEWGHNGLPWPEPSEQPGPDCYCGKRGCIETFLSGPGLAADHARSTGARLLAPEIVAAAAQGDPDCTATLARYQQRLARGLASVINLLDPEVIVLGGGLSNVARLVEAVPRLWGQYAFSDAVKTRLVRAAHGDSSGVRGAAWLWPLAG